MLLSRFPGRDILTVFPSGRPRCVHYNIISTFNKTHLINYSNSKRPYILCTHSKYFTGKQNNIFFYPNHSKKPFKLKLGLTYILSCCCWYSSCREPVPQTPQSLTSSQISHYFEFLCHLLLQAIAKEKTKLVR